MIKMNEAIGKPIPTYTRTIMTLNNVKTYLIEIHDDDAIELLDEVITHCEDKLEEHKHAENTAH